MYYFCFGVGFGFSVFLVCMVLVLVRHIIFFSSFIVAVYFFFINIVWFISLANQCKSFYYNVWLTFPVSVMNYYILTGFFFLLMIFVSLFYFLLFNGIHWNDYIKVDLYASRVKTEIQIHIFGFFFFFMSFTHNGLNDWQPKAKIVAQSNNTLNLLMSVKLIILFFFMPTWYSVIIQFTFGLVTRWSTTTTTKTTMMMMMMKTKATTIKSVKRNLASLCVKYIRKITKLIAIWSHFVFLLSIYFGWNVCV